VFVAFPKSNYCFNDNDRINIAGLTKNVNKVKGIYFTLLDINI